MATFLRHIPRDHRTIIRRPAHGPVTVDEPVVYTSKLPGDPIALRGIPAIGRGVTGAIRGTKPGSVR